MPRNIMIVEDDPLLAMNLETIVEDAGYVVVGLAHNMATAMTIAASDQVDIAIMDIRLSGGDSGVETAKRLRQRHDVPALFVSGSINDEVKAMALPWQPLGFIPKPYEDKAILRALGASQSSASASVPTKE